MSKIKKFFTALGILFRKPYLLNLVINHEDSFQAQVLKNYLFKNGLPQLSVLDLFSEFSETVKPYAFLEGGSSPLDLALLKALAKKYAVNSVLEIGTWRGESIANLALVGCNCYTLNLSDEEVYKLWPNCDYVASHRFFSKNLSNVHHIFGHSNTFDFSRLNQRFDMIFIDGDHHYDSVKADTISAFKLIDVDKGIIVWHDYTYNPEKIRWEVFQAILDGTPKEKHKNLYHIANTHCAVYIPEELKGVTMIPYALPKTVFELTIKAQPVETVSVNEATTGEMAG